MKRFILILSISFLLCAFQNAAAQKKPVKQKKSRPTVINCGVCNQKAIYLPKPVYPKTARFVNASGAVNVQILINEKGNVIEAKAVSGHSFLRAAAVEAAREAKFEPFLLSNKAVRAYGVIVYNFTLNTFQETKNGGALIETIPLGVLNDKALKMWFAQNQAKNLRLTGEIQVQATINLQEGRVILAKAISAYGLFGALAEMSALQATFQPTLAEFPTIYGTGILIFKANDFTGKIVENKNPNPIFPLISGGIVNGGAKNLLKPEYTDEAKKACASGKVEVNVLIYMATGKIISAKAVSGNVLLRKSAEDAVMKSEFSVPNINGNKDVYIKGKIIYNFLPNKNC